MPHEKTTIKLSKEQKRIVNSSQRDKVVTPGPGSGKSRICIAMAVNSTLACNKKPLLLTFSNNASLELKKRSAKLPTDIAERIDVMTTHSFSYHLIKKFKPSSFLPPATNDIQVKAMKETLAEITKQNPQLFIPNAAELLELFNFRRNNRETLSKVMQAKSPHLLDHSEIITRIRGCFRQKLREWEYLPFEDYISKAKKLLRKPAVLKHIKKTYGCLIVDEAQDLNELQWKLVIELNQALPTTVVGDPNQSINAFRAAKPQGMQDAVSRLKDAKLFELTANYRSTKPIVNFCKDILNGESTINMHSTNEGGSLPTVITFMNEHDEAQFIQKEIEHALANGEKESSIHIVARTNADADNIASELQGRGILTCRPVQDEFKKLKCFKVINSAVRLISGSTSKIDAKAYFTIFPNVGDVIAQDIIKQIKLQGMEEVFEFYYGNRSTSRGSSLYKSMCVLLDFQEEEPFKDGLICFYEEIEKVLVDSPTQLLNWKKDKADFMNFINKLPDDISIEQYVEMLDEQLTFETPDEAGVKVSTVHAVKGMEAKTCIVLNCSPTVYPHKLARSEDAIAEERRMLYTACTRAETKLIVTSRLKTKHANLFSNKYSRNLCFLNKINSDLYISL
jgi:DNA helicase-2/ATP-dependent DNA helicase PcrA